MKNNAISDATENNSDAFKNALRILAHSGQIERYRSKSKFWDKAELILWGLFLGFIIGMVLGATIKAQI